MESDDESNEELYVNEDFFLRSASRGTADELKKYFEHFKRFLSPATINYIQYCLLRIPFLMAYDYLFTEQFSSLIDKFVKFSIDVIDREQQPLFKPISYILNSYFFSLLINVNVNFSIPILGKIYFIYQFYKIFFFCFLRLNALNYFTIVCQ